MLPLIFLVFEMVFMFERHFSSILRYFWNMLHRLLAVDPRARAWSWKIFSLIAKHLLTFLEIITLNFHCVAWGLKRRHLEANFVALLKLHFQSKEKFIRHQTKEPSSVAEQKKEKSINLINFDRATTRQSRNFCAAKILWQTLNINQISVRRHTIDF